MKNSLFTVTITVLFTVFVSGNREEKNDLGSTVKVQNVKYAGVRSSSYGIKPFPDPAGWQQVMHRISRNFEGSVPCAIWIVGRMNKPTGCILEFPSDGKTYRNISFSKKDMHKSYLNYFDHNGINVFLQIEPGSADVETLINLVLNRYKHHRCVIGFGIDVEWYRENEKPKFGVKVDDRSAETWETAVKKHNESYKLFLKHWHRKWMPPNYRGDIVFVNDAQMFRNMNAMIRKFVIRWADYFKPNMVFFQVGYPRDQIWWQKLQNPLKEIVVAIDQNISQNFGIFWVDFSIRKAFQVPEKKAHTSLSFLTQYLSKYINITKNFLHTFYSWLSPYLSILESK